MHALKLAIGCAWLVFWIYWVASASTSAYPEYRSRTKMLIPFLLQDKDGRDKRGK
jgi:protein-S-isoprenylcysteine O-methyltransferase Ste14